MSLLKSQWKWTDRERLNIKEWRIWALGSSFQWMKGVQEIGKSRKEGARRWNLMARVFNEQCFSGEVTGTRTISSHLVCTRGLFSKFYLIHQSTPFNHSFAKAFLKLSFCFLQFFAFSSIKREFTGRKPPVKEKPGTSLVAQWLRIRLPIQGTRVRALVWEDPICRRATKPMHPKYWACAVEPVSHNYWAHVPQLLKPMHLEPMLRNKRSHRNEKPAHRNEE